MKCGRANYERLFCRRQSGPSDNEIAFQEGRAVCRYESGRVTYSPKRTSSVLSEIKGRYKVKENK